MGRAVGDSSHLGPDLEIYDGAHYPESEDSVIAYALPVEGPDEDAGADGGILFQLQPQPLSATEPPPVAPS